jgi:hypothetical protein
MTTLFDAATSVVPLAFVLRLRNKIMKLKCMNRLKSKNACFATCFSLLNLIFGSIIINQTTHKSLLANVFKCTFKCKRYFLTEADREEHIVSAHKTKCLMRTEAKCLYCNKICIDKHVLNSHIHKNHSAVKILCKFFQCGQFFRTQTEADEHFEQQHQQIEENKKYHCLKCNFRTASQCNFKNHISRMHGEKNLAMSKVF